MNKIRSGDEVIVLTGRDKGKRGKVLSRIDDSHVLVEGVNRVKRHTKANPQRNIGGGIVEKETPLPASKVALFNPASQKGERTGIKRLTDGKRVRYFKSNGEMVDA